MRKLLLLATLLIGFNADIVAQKSTKASFKIDYEKFTLPNGLTVIFHVDRSDPVVAVNLTAHVGSSREKPGRTGFAHLFEHLLFLESENLGKGGLDKMSARIGGSGANGSTSNDRTNYLQTVPSDALEKMIWAEADKLGWFINTVTDNVLAKEKQVVKNEKRQSYDNAPYGHTGYVIDKNLYTSDHPYNWQVIGSLEDLQNATLADVKEFFNKWYVPNNVTLTIAGDFDTAQAKKWVEKYFSEIKKGENITKQSPRPGYVSEIKKLYHEDNFARLPQLTYAWPTVENYHPDAYALSILTNYLTQGKKAPFYTVLVEDKKLTSNVNMYSRNMELAGQVQLSSVAFPGKSLNEIAAAFNEAFAKFEKEGISQKDLDRIKAGQETRFYGSLSSVLGKSSQLAQYSMFAGDPGYMEKDLAKTLEVTVEDVMRVYNKYIKGKNYVATSFVPKGQVNLALSGSTKAQVVEEAIVQGAEESINAATDGSYPRTPSSFNRSVEPPYGKAPEVKIPVVWNSKLANGLQVYGIHNTEVPLVQFNISISGGILQDDPKKVGVAYLMASLMNQGTKNKTPEELEEAIKQLGANISITAGTEDITISGNTLARNYDSTIALVEEMLLHPRWDEKEFALLKQSTLSNIRQQEASPAFMASKNYRELIYGKDNLRAQNTFGTAESISSINLDDLKAYYNKNISPSVARMNVVGSLDKSAIITSLAKLNTNWKSKSVQLVATPQPNAPAESKIYFYDIPDAKQSVLNIGYPALAQTDANYYPAVVMNYILGGGGFASQLTQELREGKGYTYGINSSFSGTQAVGPFTISSNVRTNVTLESLQAIKNILENFGKNYSENDLATTKSFLIKSNARAFETAGSKLGMLESISKYGFKPNYVKEREEIVNNMTISKIQELSKKYLNSNKMIWLIVGDAKTQLSRLKELGFGEPILLNK